MKQSYTYSDNGKSANVNSKAWNALVFSIPVFVFLFSFFTIRTQAQTCCPQFKLKDAVEICPPEGACKITGTAGGGHGMAACKLTIHEYTVYPNTPGYTYTWTIIGGTPGTFTGNPINVLWGSGASGIIKVVASNLGIGGNCIDSITQEICLIDGPKANFTLAPNTVCSNSPVHFTNTSSGGSSYLWDFGDGTTSTLANPPDHTYAIPGTYTVTLTASNAGPVNQAPDMRPPCGCIDKISKTVTVLSGAGPTIDVTCCYGTVCAGDTSSFCTPMVCTTYNWTVTGGTIISGLSTNCIKVKWFNTYSGPTTVSLSVPGCATAPCAGTTTMNVPVLYPNLPINGPLTLCVGASGSYFLPSMPGTYYLWTTTASPGNFSFNDKNKNTPNVNISFSQPGAYQLQCQYNNPMAGCSGVTSITINVLPVFSIQGDETVCQGDTITYSANGPATWFVAPVGANVPGGILTSANIVWNTPGNFTITATNTSTGVFCNPTAVKVVKVVAKPILGTISGPPLVCPGKNFTYSITSNTQGSPFVWSVSGGGTVMSEIGADRDSAIVKLSGAGPWTISVYQKIELSPGNFCKSLTKTLLVNRYSPPSITGNASVCVDAVETYVASGPVPPGGIQWTISPSFQGSVITGQGTGSVNIRWHGTPNTAIITATHCGGSATKSVSIAYPPAVSPISISGPNGYCLPNMPNNLTLTTTSGFTSYQWYLNNSSIFGANNFFYNIPNGTFTGQGTYYFSVAVSNGFCTVYQTTYIFIDSCAGGGGGTPTNPIICDVDFTINPNPACENQPVTFTAIPTGPGFSYAWDFGDNSTSFQSPTQHTYTSAGTDTVTLTATIGSCVVIKKKVITINPTPACIITTSDTIFCPGSFVILSACNGMNSYQWYRDGSLIGGATGATYNASKHGEYEVEVSNNFGCSSRSNSIYIYKHAPPIANVSGDGSVCAYPGSFSQIQLSAFYDPAYKYSWSSNAGGATFSPNNSTSNTTIVSLTLPAVLPVTYYFVALVTDTVTTCEARDTICVTFYETPPLTIPYFAACQAGAVTFTPNLVDTLKYKYFWSNGQTTPSITVIAAGSYALTITDKSTGCSATAPAGVIYPKPDLSLFPTGCDTIMCKTDSLHMYIPLPLNFLPPFNTYANAYPTINWYDNGNYGTPIATGQNFYFLAPTSGSHQISVVVETNHGCADTAGVFCLTVICGDIQFGHCPSGPITLPCNAVHPTVADALAAVGAITDSCPGPINVSVTGGVATPLTGCWWKATFVITASNNCGQTDSCIVTFRWKEDHEPPSFSTCPSGPVILPCNTPRPTTTDALALIGSATDNCPGTVNVLVAGGVATPTNGCNWTATFVATATDSCNNSTICNVVYNWKEDTIPPQFAHCPTGPVILPCNAPRPVEDEPLILVGPVTDNCPDPISVVMTGGAAVPAGGCNWSATYTITATDACGNTNVCNLTYLWKEDHIPPSFAHCPAAPVKLPCNSPHPLEADALVAAGAITDNCPGTLDIQVTGGVATPVNGCNWTSMFSITATDSCGNASSCVITFNWKEDLLPPQFTHCPQGPVTLPCNTKPILGEILYEIGPITDNCPGHIDVQVSGGIPTPTTGCNWTATFTITATDSCGNVNVCTATYNWKEDHQAPVFAHCPAGPINLPCNSPRPQEADALAIAGAVTDNCPGTIIQVSGGIPILTANCSYTSTFTITAADSCGNTTSCAITYNWKEDTIPPQFAHCPAGPINLPCNTHPFPGELLYEIGPITDNCSGHVDVQVTGGTPVPTTGCNWTATYTITATDSCGNVNVCSVTYNWKEDHQAPTFAHCPAGPINLPCNSPRPQEADALAIAGAVTDNCPGTIIQVSGGIPILTANCSYTSTFTITAADSCGNTTSCAITYNWKEDTIPPQFAHCPTGPINLPCNSHPAAGEILYEIGPITDNCSGHVNVQVTGGTPTLVSGCNWTATYLITATDSCGNTSVCNLTYNWKEDHTPPVFAYCPQESITLPCNNHPIPMDVLTLVGPVTDNCGGVLSTDISSGPATETGGCGWTKTFTITATDSCGNQAFCQVTYNWKEDHIPPVYAHCPVRPITLPCNAPHPTTNEAVVAAGPVTDNCYIDNIQVTDGGIIATTNCWYMETFTLTATDGCGNVTVCRVTYRWKEDHTAPQFAHCPTAAIELPCNTTRPNISQVLAATGAVTDNCPGNIFYADCWPPVGGHFDSPELVSYGSGFAMRNFVQAEFTDCFPLPVAIGQTDVHTYGSVATFEMSQDGGNNWEPFNATAETTVKITKVDENETERFFDTEILSMNITGGNLPQGFRLRESPTNQSLGETVIQTGSDDFQISSFFDTYTEISQDGGQSWIVGNQPIHLNLAGPVIVHVTPGYIASTTGCGLTQTFTVSATDACGNSNTCSVTYNWKEDHTPPVFAHCPDGPVILPCNSPRPTSNNALSLIGTISDNCPGSVFVQVADGGLFTTGGCGWSETFTVTATDACGNSSVCHVTYMWKEDHVKPTFTRPNDITIYADETGNYNASVAITGDVFNEEDNCATGLNATFVDVISSGIHPVWRIISRTWSLADDCGNAAADQVQTITVLDPSGGKTLTLSVFLEGLYEGSGILRKTQDETGDHFSGDTADVITVELHRALQYAVVDYAATKVKLNTGGSAVVNIPSFIHDSYYLTIRHRNSVETTSAMPLDFSGNPISYTFDTQSKAYGNNMGVMIDGTVVIFTGDENQDNLVDGSDLSEIANKALFATAGYIPEDLNGDGLVDGSDLSIAGNNTDDAIGAILP